jgi:uncharacterized protein (DUF2336 family)
MQTSATLLCDLEAAVQAGSQEQRIEMMRHVTALFLGNTERLSEEQVDLFGDVLVRLTEQVECRVLAELGAKLGPIKNAPNAIILNLARHDEIAVAGPVLSQSPRLSDQDLIEIAKIKGQDHLGAISDRPQLTSSVTDILIDRGNAEVAYRLSRNPGAAFSAGGFTTLTRRAERDVRLAETLGKRADLPPQLLRELVSKATDAVRKNLLAAAPPQSQATIQEALATVSVRIMEEAIDRRNFSKAEAAVTAMIRENRFDEAAIIELASAGRYEEVVASLAKRCAASVDLVDRLMHNSEFKATLITCKAADLSWPAFNAVLKVRPVGYPLSPAEIEHARMDYGKLSVTTAQRMFRFWVIRGATELQFDMH